MIFFVGGGGKQGGAGSEERSGMGLIDAVVDTNRMTNNSNPGFYKRPS